MDYAKESLRLHGEWKGKIEVVATVSANDKESLSLAYTPGVAQPCLEIQAHPEKSYELTRRHNNANVLALAGGFTGPFEAERIVETFLITEFEGGRHQRRVDKIMALEET